MEPTVERPRRIPVATYRLQVHGGFPLAEARRRVPYLHRLGVTDLYSSPLLASRPGSPHGYDVVDPTRVDPEVGGEEVLRALGADLDERGMGLVLDIVPNHMAAIAENPWWRHVLAHGRSSPYAPFFDVRWDRERDGRLLLPILGDPYGDELDAGNLRLEVDPEEGLVLRYWERRLPVAALSYRHLLAHRLAERRAELGPEHGALVSFRSLLAQLGCDADGSPVVAGERSGGEEGAEAPPVELVARRLGRLWEDRDGRPSPRELLEEALEEINADPARLDRVIGEQPYRPACWRLAAEGVNYRRFFDVAELAGVRQEDEGVFAATHRLVLRLVREGVVDALRLDHVDGLRDPAEYLRRLQAGATGEGEAPLWVVVEKILAADEELPAGWPVAGTTGYDFQNSLTGLFVDPDGLRDLDRLYARYTGDLSGFEEVRYRHKKRALAELFPGELAALAADLVELAAADRSARDLPPSELGRALEETTACLAVYRTYAGGSPAGVSERDREVLQRSLAEGRQRAGERPLTGRAFAFLERVLTLDPPPELAAERPRWHDFVARWQQLTGPAMAKGLEDTALYVYNRLLSLNAVGGEPEGIDPPGDAAAFHHRNAVRRRRWPHAMTCSSTHDAKRSEDVRARISVLSERAGDWRRHVERWTEMNRAKKTTVAGRLAPDANEEVFLYQTLVGAWPLHPEEGDDFRERLERYLVKAAREAKVNTSWHEPDEDWEEALLGFTRALLDPGPNPFLDELLGFVDVVAFYGAWSSLSQLVLQVAAPGVPDFYQGTELWNLSLVDPDNRRPVDWELRERYLEELEERSAAAEEGRGPHSELLAELVDGWRDGRVKLWTTWRSLTARRRHAELFLDGDYVPLETAGEHADSVIAFARRHDDRWAVAVAPRWLGRVVEPGEAPLGAAWGDTTVRLSTVRLPEGRVLDGECRNVLDGERRRLQPGDVAVADLFSRLPVALLVG